MEAELKKLTDYFRQFDGRHTWKDAEPLYDALMHRDLQVTIHKGEMTNVEWKDVAKHLVNQGTVAELLSAKAVHDDSVNYTVVYHLATGDLTVQSTAKFFDSQMVEDKPAEPAMYNNLAALAHT